MVKIVVAGKRLDDMIDIHRERGDGGGGGGGGGRRRRRRFVVVVVV